ncbi:MAG: hypothetical protein HOP29_04955 [Phycisphaerales bacterium]|nr:hypothetical protein [Phycisphaerales bacterium]
MNPIRALLLFPFRPRRVALAFQHAPLWHVYLVHCLGMAAIAGVLAAVDAWNSEGWSRRGDSVVLEIVSSYESVLIFLFVLLCGEMWFLCTALVMVCWAGREEPLRETWRYALRVGWLYTGDLFWVVVVWVIWLGYSALEPIRVSGRDFPMLIWTIVGTIIWSIVAYLRALTASRDSPLAVNRCDESHDSDDPMNEPLCEWCGYLLVQIDPNGPCPECGRGVADSVANNARSPFGPSMSSWTRSFRVWGGSERFFRQLAVNRRNGLGVVMMACSTASGGIVGALAFIVGFMMVGEHVPDLHEMAGILTGMAGFIGWVFLMVVSLLASGLGVVASRRVGRNRQTAAWNVVAFFSPVLPVWSAIAMAMLPILNHARSTPLTFLWWLLGNVGVAILFGIMCGRRLPYVEYANR